MNNIRNKLKIIKKIFLYSLSDTKTDSNIDYESSREGYSRAYKIAYYSQLFDNKNPYIITKNDLKYINKICKRLIEIVGTNELVLENIKIILDNNNLNDIWLNAYIQLLKIYSSNKL
jgi:hypothetical protein